MYLRKERFPNEEVRNTFIRAVKNDGWDAVMKAIDASEALLKEYKGNILLVGISYEKKNKKHQCRIENLKCDFYMSAVKEGSYSHKQTGDENIKENAELPKRKHFTEWL